MISVVLVTSLASEDEHDYSLSTFSSHESREVTPYVPRESPIDSYESPSDTLPELIIEVEKKYQYDEPKEVYDKLDKSMANLYKKYILKIDDGTSSVDSIVERYEAEMHNDDERNIERSVEEELERPDRQDTDNENDDSENGTDEEGNDNGSPENKAEGDVIYRTAKVPGLSPIQEVREDFSRISLYEGQQARERASRSYLQVTEGRGEASINGSIRDEGRASDSLAKTTAQS
nr:uncharacterized protein LOC117989788 [Maniola hyperantus]